MTSGHLLNNLMFLSRASWLVKDLAFSMVKICKCKDTHFPYTSDCCSNNLHLITFWLAQLEMHQTTMWEAQIGRAHV